MAIGAYRNLVRLENPGPPVADGKGGYTETWAPLSPPTWFCAFQAAAARVVERMTSGVMQATATHLVEGRHHPGITTETRLLFEGRTLQVQSVTDRWERHRISILVCSEVVGGGLEPTADRRARGATGGASRVAP